MGPGLDKLSFGAKLMSRLHSCNYKLSSFRVPEVFRVK